MLPSRLRLRLVPLALLLAPVAFAAPAALAHDGLHERLASLDARIKEEGPSARRYVERAELLRLHGELTPALADLERAGALAPEDTDVAFGRAKVLFDLGRHADARVPLERVLAARPADPAALLLAAQVLTELGELERALARYERALAQAQPHPDHHLAHARLVHRIDSSQGRGPERALALLDAGIAHFGSIPALVLTAIDYELERAHFDAALARLEPLAARSSRREPWLARRAEILERAGRQAEALSTWRAARGALESLPRRQRTRQDSLRLERTIDARIRALTRNDNP